MSTSVPLGKHLASSDKKIRDKAVQGLSAFLCDGDAKLSEKDMAKLWKGIFYCFWMSDKPLVQQALATDLANILLKIPSADAALAFLKGFWDALVREWAGIDRLRMDKFYMLIRRYVNASFRLLMREGWDSSACERYNDILRREDGPLSPSNAKIPAGLQYHLTDIYIPELDKAFAAFPEGESPAPLLTLLEPFFVLASQTPSNITFKRIQTSLLDPLVTSLTDASRPRHDESSVPSRKRQKLSSDTAEVPEGGSALPEDFPLRHVVMQSTVGGADRVPSSPRVIKSSVIQSLFEIASREATRDSNRRKIYAICKDAKDEDDEEN